AGYQSHRDVLVQQTSAQDHAAAGKRIDYQYFVAAGKKGEASTRPFFPGKVGVGGLTTVVALENCGFKIQVNCLDPGGIVATEAIKNIPGNRGIRMLSPAIVRACAVHLASDESSGITGRSFVATDWNQEHGLEVPYTVA